MQGEKPTDTVMEGFLASHETYTDFRKFINHLLSTFMPDDVRNVFMSEDVTELVDRSAQTGGFTRVERLPIGIGPDYKPSGGPFAIMRRAFMHAAVTDISLESLETLGDSVLNESVCMMIVGNWPNLTSQASQVANMKQYYTKNSNIARYAEKLGLIRWVVRGKGQGLDSKERADIFESFIGAIVLIGEFYIGPQMGLAYARVFLDKFLATEKWYPEIPEFYERPENLWNDWTTALPGSNKDHPTKVIKTRQDEEGMWHVSLTVRDPDPKISQRRPIHDKVGKSVLSFAAVARKKDDAERSVFLTLGELLELKRTDINLEREKKRALQPNINALVNEIKALGGKKDYFVPTKKMAGRVTYVYVKERTKAVVGNRELRYERTIASGSGESEEEALKVVIAKLKRGDVFQTVAGTEFEIWNPDVTVLKAPENPADYPKQEKDVPVTVKNPKKDGDRNQHRDSPRQSQSFSGRGRGRGRSSEPSSKPPTSNFISTFQDL